ALGVPDRLSNHVAGPKGPARSRFDLPFAASCLRLLPVRKSLRRLVIARLHQVSIISSSRRVPRIDPVDRSSRMYQTRHSSRSFRLQRWEAGSNSTSTPSPKPKREGYEGRRGMSVFIVALPR